MEALLHVNALTKTYGTAGTTFQALNNINFTIETGEFVGIMGASGAGKSTLLNMLATIDTPTSGDIIIDGTNISQMNGDALADFRRDHLGFIFQDYNLLDSLTVRENIVLPLAIAKRPVNEIEQQVQTIATLFGIEALLDKYPYQISGGQKQRTAASRALVTEPKLILADEPTGALDSKSATELLNSLVRLNEEKESTIMMVTHDAYAASFCRRIIFIQDGQLATEIFKGTKTRKQFFENVLQTLGQIGGDIDDVI